MAPPPEQLKALADADRENGLKAMRAGNYEKAVQLLGKCLENLVVLYGEVAPECAYTYFKYGTALFYKSQEDADVMGSDNAVKQAAEAKKEKKAAEKGSASEPGTSNKAGEAKEASAGKESGDAPAAVPDRKGKGPAKVEAAEEEEDDDEEEGGDGEHEEDIGEEEEEAVDDESDLALAWQVLESARVIYERMPARSLDEADVIMTLADISMEKEEFANCVADYHRAIGLLHALLPPHHRRIAEAYFRLCLAHQTAQQPIEALASCRKAIESCTLCVKHLKGRIGDAAPGPEGTRDSAPGSHAPPGPEHSKGAAAAEPADAPRASSAGAAGGAEAATVSAPSGEASSSAASDPAAAATRREEALKELEEVEAVVGDLKEKEAEIVEMLSNPSLQHLLASAAAKAGSEPAKGTGAGGAEAGDKKPLGAPIIGEGAAGSSKAQFVSGNAQNVDQGVAVVGRGKKRVAPTPIDPALPNDAKRLC